jgi:hypothetical protein
MNSPVMPEEVKVVHGHAGRGLQVVCSCGCINLNYPESTDPTWRCRNCGRLITADFTRLAAAVLAAQRQEPASSPS